jgi:hypothetical protein
MRLTWHRHENAAEMRVIASRLMRGLLPTKPYRIEWIGEPGASVAAFDQLQTAIEYVRDLNRDQQHVIIHGREVVWPSNVRRSVGPGAPGGAE